MPGAEAGLCALEGCGGLRRVPERGAGPGEDLEEGRGRLGAEKGTGGKRDVGTELGKERWLKDLSVDGGDFSRVHQVSEATCGT